MRVGFDTSPLHRPHPPGVTRATRELLAALTRRAVMEIVPLAPSPDEDLRKWRQQGLRNACLEHDLAGVHSPVSAFPLRGAGRRVQTIHEAPWRHGVRENAGWKHRLWASFGARRADATLTPTRHVARDLGQRLASDGGKLHVTPWGVESRFDCEPPPGEVDEALLARYSLREGPFALCVGATREKKNLSAVLHGLAARVARGERDLTLVVTGPHSRDLQRDLGLVSKLGLARCVSTPGEIDDAHLPGLLRLASVVPVLSRSEGFALPVVEALACGTPVLVPPRSAQEEVAHGGAIVVDPLDPDGVADGLERALVQREERRYELPTFVAHLTWDRCAEQVEGIWQGLAGSAPHTPGAREVAT